MFGVIKIPWELSTECVQLSDDNYLAIFEDLFWK